MSQFTSKRLTIITASIGALLVGSVLMAWPGSDKSTLISERPKVVTEVIEAREEVKELTYPAKVEAIVSSTVISEVDGLIIKILKPLGSKVKRGTVILYLKNIDPGFTYASVPIRAPFNGVISQHFGTLMGKVNHGEKLFTIVNPDQVKITAEIPGDDLKYLDAGTSGDFTLGSQDANIAQVKIRGYSPTVDPRTGTAQADIQFLAGKVQAHIGSVGYVRFKIPAGKQIIISDASVTYFGVNPIVHIVNKDLVVKKQVVELGDSRGTDFVVRSGLKGGEKIVVSTSRPLKEGEKVVEEPTKALDQ